MKEIKGITYLYYETGTEGAYYAVLDESKSDFYESLVLLEENDEIIIWNKNKTQIIYQGAIKKDRQKNLTQFSWVEKYRNNQVEFREKFNRDFPSKEEIELYYSQQASLGIWVHWLQADVDDKLWTQWFLEELPVLLIKNNSLIF